MSDIRHVVTNFLRYQGKILLFQRSLKVGTYQGKWAGCSGYIEGDEDPDIRAIIEIKEETKLTENQIVLIKKGETLKVNDEEKGIIFIVHPYLWETKTDQIEIDWEHKNFKWIAPGDITNYSTVPKLKDALEKVLDI